MPTWLTTVEAAFSLMVKGIENCTWYTSCILINIFKECWSPFPHLCLDWTTLHEWFFNHRLLFPDYFTLLADKAKEAGLQLVENVKAIYSFVTAVESTTMAN